MIIRSIMLTWPHTIGQELHSYTIFLLSSWHADDNEHTLSIHGNLRALASYLVHGSGLTPAATQYTRPTLVTNIGSHHPNLVGCFIRVDKSGFIPAATLHTISMMVIIEISYDLLGGLSKVVIDLLVRLFKAGVSLSQNTRKSLHLLEETYKLIAS